MLGEDCRQHQVRHGRRVAADQPVDVACARGRRRPAQRWRPRSSGRACCGLVPAVGGQAGAADELTILHHGEAPRVMNGSGLLAAACSVDQFRPPTRVMRSVSAAMLIAATGLPSWDRDRHADAAHARRPPVEEERDSRARGRRDLRLDRSSVSLRIGLRLAARPARGRPRSPRPAARRAAPCCRRRRPAAAGCRCPGSWRGSERRRSRGRCRPPRCRCAPRAGPCPRQAGEPDQPGRASSRRSCGRCRPAASARLSAPEHDSAWPVVDPLGRSLPATSVSRMRSAVTLLSPVLARDLARAAGALAPTSARRSRADLLDGVDAARHAVGIGALRIRPSRPASRASRRHPAAAAAARSAGSGSGRARAASRQAAPGARSRPDARRA